MAEKFSRYDTAEYLETEEDIRHYLEACQDDGDPALIAAALGDIARARNMTELARLDGVEESLRRSREMDENPQMSLTEEEFFASFREYRTEKQ